MKSENTVWNDGKISKEDRSKLLGYNNKVIWFTGLPGSGKSTLGKELEKKLHEKGYLTYVLDGDNVRHGLNGDLGFSPEDREENIRRIGEVAKLFYDSGVLVIACFISPYKKDRDNARNKIGKDFVEVHVKCDVETCEKRYTKGLYDMAKKGKIKDFTGVSAPYEEPENPEVVVDTAKLGVEESVEKILDYLKL